MKIETTSFAAEKVSLQHKHVWKYVSSRTDADRQCLQLSILAKLLTIIIRRSCS